MTVIAFTLPPDDGRTLVERIVALIEVAVAERRLRPGSRAPSIRALAAELGVSAFTVTDAYDRLAGRGLLEPRRGSGFYVAGQRPPVRIAPLPPLGELAVDAQTLSHSVYEDSDTLLPVGGGWLPPGWFDDAALKKAFRQLARSGSVPALYGRPQGWLPLRRRVAERLAEHGIDADVRQITLTQGASQALELAAALLARPGDTVLVDDPGYSNLISSLQLRGLVVIGVPWTEAGPDLVALEALAALHRPRAFFTNPWLQNPTGCSYNAATAFGVLRLAHQHDFTVVEDNVSAELLPARQTPLAAHAGLGRVVYVGSFSKTLSPALRVGFIAADPGQSEDIAHVKMMTGLTSSEINERLALAMLEDGACRKQTERLRERLGHAQSAARERLAGMGFECFGQVDTGMFVWARRAGSVPLDLARRASRAGVMLAPGELFRPGRTDSEWLRFNAAFCAEADRRLDAALVV